MNRSARIGALAKTGQVWCSQDAWAGYADEEACSSQHPGGLSGATQQQGVGAEATSSTPLMGVPLGSFKLKGVGERELVQVRLGG